MPLGDHNSEPYLSKFAMAGRLQLPNLIERTQSGLDRAKRESKTRTTCQRACQNH